LDGKLTRRDYMVDLEVDGNRIDFREIGYEIMHWIQLVQGRIQWQALVNTAMKLRIHKGKKFLGVC
jgi:hypothetical protein